jgi:ElaA protein
MRHGRLPVTKIVWQWMAFDELDGVAMHAMLAARQQVFVLEQQCLYPDIDGLDPHARHLLGWQDSDGVKTLIAYLRCFAPHAKNVDQGDVVMGRVLTLQAVRGTGTGRQLMAEGIRRVEQDFPDCRMRISAQQHLQRFYGDFGFVTVSDSYLEDGIPHVDMIREAGDRHS